MATYGTLVPDPTKVRPSYRIAGKDLREFGIEVTSYPELLLPAITPRRVEIPGRVGMLDFGSIWSTREFDLTFQIRASDHDDFVHKRDKFLQWIQLPQNVNEYLIYGKRVRALKFELAGHRYIYKSGSVSVTQGSTLVTGSGTRWKSYLAPGADFEIDGDSAKYKVVAVHSDTTLTLSKPVGRSTASGLSYEASRPRYLLVNYNGSSSAAPQVSRSTFVDFIYECSVSFVALYPFWRTWEFEKEISGSDFETIGSDQILFTEIEGLGTAPVHPLIKMEGSLTDPIVVSGELAALSHFSPSSIDPSFNTLSSPSGVAASYTTKVGWRPSKIGKGIGIFGRPDGKKGDDLRISRGAEVKNYMGKMGDFNGSTSYIEVYIAPVPTSFSLECWIKPSSYSQTMSLVEIRPGGPAATASIARLMYEVTQNALLFAIEGLTASVTLMVDATNYPAGEWHHLVGVYDAPTDTLSFYINGALVRQGTGSGTLDTAETSSSIFVGTCTAFYRYFQGLMDEVRVWFRALSASEIADHYKAPHCPFDAADGTTDLRLWYKMDGDATDSSGYGNHGTATDVDFTQDSVVMAPIYENFDWTRGAIELWVKSNWDADDSKYHEVLSVYQHVNNRLQIFRDNDNRLKAIIEFSNVRIKLATSPLSALDWAAGENKHILVAWDTTSAFDGTNYAKLWLNGSVLSSQTAKPGQLEQTPSDFRLGANPSGIGHFDGTLQLRIWRRPIDVSESAWQNGSPSASDWYCDQDVVFVMRQDASGTITTSSVIGASWPEGEATYGNKVPDGDFEDEKLDPSITLSAVGELSKSTDAQTGLLSLDGVNNDPAVTSNIAYQSLNGLTDGDYLLGGHLRVVQGTFAGLGLWDATVGVSRARIETTSTSWVLEESVAAITAANTNRFEYKSWGATPSQARFDSIHLHKSLLNNGGFETGDLSNWALGGTVTVISTDKHSGTYSCQVASGGDLGQATASGAPKDVTMICWVKGSGRIRLAPRDANQVWRSNIREKVVTNLTNWTRVVLTSSDDGVDSWAARFDADQGADLFVDDVAIIPLDPVQPAVLTPLDKAYTYFPSRHEQALLITSGSTPSVLNCYANKDQYGFVVRLQPQFPGTAVSGADDKVVFQHIAGASDRYFELRYVWSSGVWRFKIKNGASERYIESDTQRFEVDEYIEVSGLYHKDRNEMMLLVNGIATAQSVKNETGASASPNIELSDYPRTLYIGHDQAGEYQADSKFDELAIYFKAPTSDELRAVFVEADEIKWTNAEFKYTGTLDPGDILTLDFENETYEEYDASAGTTRDVFAKCSGNIPTLISRADNRWVLFLKSPAAKTTIKYVPQWL